MWFESGTGPQIGTFGKPGEKWSSRLQAAQKAREQSESMDRKRVEAIREYEYDQRRKQWKRRLGHLKALCVVVILGYRTSV
jgi:flagellar biosynthesis/type III secretory pathway M-ring protein FliF/YscJ